MVNHLKNIHVLYHEFILKHTYTYLYRHVYSENMFIHGNDRHYLFPNANYVQHSFIYPCHHVLLNTKAI